MMAVFRSAAERLAMIQRACLAMVTLCVVLAAGCASQRPVHEMRREGDRLFERSEYAAAAAEYEQIVDRYPGDWRGQYQLGRCYLVLNEFDDARTALEVAYTRRPANIDVVDALAEAMYGQGSENELFAFLREQAQLTQSSVAYLRLADYSMRLGDPDSALLALDTAIAMDEGTTVDPYLAAAEFARQIDRPDLAKRRLRQAFGIDPHNEEVRRLLREMGEVPGPSIVLPPGP